MELGYCVPLALPHSVFLSWDSDDQDKALAYQLWKASLCPGCGSDPHAWTGDDGLPLDPPPFTTSSVACHGCATLEEEREQIPPDRRSWVRPYLKPN